jgi:hypothetical protein
MSLGMTHRIILITLLAAAGAFAQESAGYIFAAPGRTSAPSTATIQGGAGGELVWRYFGLGGDVSWLAPQRSFSDGFGALSIDPAIHIPTHGHASIDPYFLGGYTLFFRSGTASGGNYGGGVNWWFNHDFGLKLELRDQVVHSTHYWGFRVGLNFHVD